MDSALVLWMEDSVKAYPRQKDWILSTKLRGCQDATRPSLMLRAFTNSKERKKEKPAVVHSPHKLALYVKLPDFNLVGCQIACLHALQGVQFPY